MTAQAIDGAPLQFSNVVNNQSDTMIIKEKVGLATTLAFFVGIIQVYFLNSTILRL